MFIKTRFAPSPSGDLHIGNLRAALIPFIFSAKKNGCFFLRIDNTNKNSFSKKKIINIIKDLKKFRIKYTFIKYQSRRIRIYIKYSLILLKKKKAYVKDGAIYYKVKKEDVSKFNDILRGKVEVKNKGISDFIIIRKNGFSTFNFACAIDDYLENVNFVFRGEEHIINTIKQKIIISNFISKKINYCHIPNILDANGKKISKRKKTNSIKKILKKGILRSAIVNYILNIGFSNEDKLFNNFKKIKKNFNEKKIILSPAKYDFKKLIWYNKKHILMLDKKKIINFLKTKKAYHFLNDKTIKFIKERSFFLKDIFNIYRKYFLNISNFKRIIKRDVIILFNKLKRISWEKKEIIELISNYRNKKIYQKLNIFFFKKKKNVPSIIDIIDILGKKYFLDNF
ncbi:glutamate--tRNA ligase [Candidatus Vidania fulgoroideorum]